jgi:hypothetical protein
MESRLLWQVRADANGSASKARGCTVAYSDVGVMLITPSIPCPINDCEFRVDMAAPEGQASVFFAIEASGNNFLFKAWRMDTGVAVEFDEFVCTISCSKVDGG